jgi:hypothetical protein
MCVLCYAHFHTSLRKYHTHPTPASLGRLRHVTLCFNLTPKIAWFKYPAFGIEVARFKCYLL